MDACLVMLLILVIFIIIVIALVLFGRRRKFLCKIPNRDLLSFKKDIIDKFKSCNYLIKEKENNKVFVQKDNFSATTLVFKQNGQDVDVLFIHSNSTILLVAIIALIFIAWIIAIVLAIIADSNSKIFRNNELIPLIKQKGGNCKKCGRSIPVDSKICPYCGENII